MVPGRALAHRRTPSAGPRPGLQTIHIQEADMVEICLGKKTIGAACALLSGGFLVVGLAHAADGDRPANKRQLPQYNAAGELLLPKDFHSWIFVGAPLTPNALNDGKANFPEYHNVYIEPGSYAIFLKTGKFPEGTMMFKELQLTLPAENPDGSRTEPSGRGFFPGAFNGADVTVKDSKRYSETNGWGFFNFNHFEPKAASAKLLPKEECGYCHMASAKKDMVWTQFYRLLDK
jgi:hypothetical protein